METPVLFFSVSHWKELRNWPKILITLESASSLYNHSFLSIMFSLGCACPGGPSCTHGSLLASVLIATVSCLLLPYARRIYFEVWLWSKRQKSGHDIGCGYEFPMNGFQRIQASAVCSFGHWKGYTVFFRIYLGVIPQLQNIKECHRLILEWHFKKNGMTFLVFQPEVSNVMFLKYAANGGENGILKVIP